MQEFLSDRIKSITPSATLAMYRQAYLLRAQSHDVCDLSVGEPSFPTPYTIQQAAKQAIDAGIYFSYSPTAGYKDLREAIAKKLSQENNIPCHFNQIVVSTGAKQSLANLFLCLLNPGDEVVVYTPYWVTYASIIRLAGGKPVFLKGSLERNFEPTAEQLDRAINPKTKAIIFSSPSNPAGLVLSKSSLMAIAAVIEKHKQVLVIADEIYEYINFLDDFTSIGSIPSIQDRVVTVNGFSKSFAMTGWRVGYLAAPLWLADACEKIQGQLTSGTCSIAQRAALAAFDLDPKIMEDMRVAYLRRRDLIMQYIQQIPGITCNTPSGGFYIFPDISHYFGYTDGRNVINNAEEFCMYILKEAKVTVVPGTTFGDAHCIRVSYATSNEIIQKGMERMQEALAKLNPSTSNRATK